ncbi:MAG: DUF3375 domain-containing protein [Bacteroidota bacterium]
MQHEEIKRLIANSSTVKLLRAKRAPLIITFLYKAFKARNQIVIPAYELMNQLAEFLENLDDRDILDLQDSDTLKLARHYVDVWCSEDNRYLRRYPDEQGEPMTELTTNTEKAFQWIESLQKREFVGTESRFLNIYRQLRDLIDNTAADPKTRIKELERRRKAINQEIKRIKKEGVVSTYNDTQIKERFFNITRTARELISDFKEVETNFKDISLNIYRQQTRQGMNKGQILGYALDATEELKTSDQGKSFYAFWQFLIADNKQDELMELIESTYDILRKRDIVIADNFLRKIKLFLHNAGQKVIDSNHLLAEKLSRILAERNILERRRAREIINEIKNLASRKMNQFQGRRVFLEIDGLPEFDLSLDRPLGRKPQVANFKNQPTEVGSTQLEKAELEVLFDQFEMDKQVLESKIADLLQAQNQVSLGEVLKIYPIENGLEEIITYISIASKSNIHQIESTKREEIAWKLEETGQHKTIMLPKVVFLRNDEIINSGS